MNKGKIAEEQFPGHEWQVYPLVPEVMNFLEKKFKAQGTSLKESEMNGQKNGRDAIYYRINAKIADLLKAKFNGLYFIRHRKPHEIKDMFPWAEWLEGEKRVSIGTRSLNPWRPNANTELTLKNSSKKMSKRRKARTHNDAKEG